MADDKKDGMVCKCCGVHGGMCCSGMHRFFWLRVILGVILVVVVFWAGYKLGELKGFFDRSSGFGGGYGMMMQRYPGRGMMMSGAGKMPYGTMPTSSTSTQ